MEATALVFLLVLAGLAYGSLRGGGPRARLRPSDEEEKVRRLAEIEKKPADPMPYLHLLEMFRRTADRDGARALHRQALEHLKDHPVVRDLAELALFGDRYGRGQPATLPGPVELSRQRMRFDLDHDRFEIEVSDFWFQDFLEIDRARIHLENYSAPRAAGDPDPRRYRVMHAGGRIVEERLNAFLNHPRFLSALPVPLALWIELSVGEMLIKGRLGPMQFQIPIGVRVQSHYLVVISLLGPPWVMGAIPIPAGMIFDQVAARAVKAGRGMIRKLDGWSLGLDVRPLFPFEPELNLVDLSLRPGELTFTCDAVRAEAEMTRPPPPPPARPPGMRIPLSGTPRLMSAGRDELRRAMIVGDREGAVRQLEAILEKGDMLGPDAELGRTALSYDRPDLAMDLALPAGMVAGGESYLIAAEAATTLGDQEKAKHLLHEAVERAVMVEEELRSEFLLSAARLAASTEILRTSILGEILDPERWPPGTRTEPMREAIRIATEKDPGGLGRALARLWCERDPFLTEAHLSRARCHELSGDSLTAWIEFGIAHVLDPASDLAQRGRARNAPNPPESSGVREVLRLAETLHEPSPGPAWVAALPVLAPHLDWVWAEPEDPTLMQRTTAAPAALAARCRRAADLLGAPDLPVRVGLPRWPSGSALSGGERWLVLDERRLVRLDPGEIDFYVGHEVTHLALGHARYLTLPDERLAFFRAALSHLPSASRRSRRPWMRQLLGGALAGRHALGTRFLAMLGESARFSALWFSVPEHVMERIPDRVLAEPPEVGSRAALTGWLCDVADRGGVLVAGDPKLALSSMIKVEVDAWSLREEILSRGLEWAHGRLSASTHRRLRKLITTLSTDSFRDRLLCSLRPPDKVT